MKVTILGCGPAGLFAAHAAIGLGCDVEILSKPRKSYMRGAQYLHQPIPGLSGAPFQVDYRIEGSVQGYRDKVYGDMSDVQVSPETLAGVADAWDIREAYDNAWREYGHLVRPWDASFKGLEELHLSGRLVINTIPRKQLCFDDRHSFDSQVIWSTDFVRYQGAFTHEDGTLADNTVICSGNEDDWWYRQSRIHGWENTEYPFSRRPSSDRVWQVEKPLRTDCDCWPSFYHKGRYGEWKKGVLSHTAFYETEQLVMDVIDGIVA